MDNDKLDNIETLLSAMFERLAPTTTLRKPPTLLSTIATYTGIAAVSLVAIASLKYLATPQEQSVIITHNDVHNDTRTDNHCYLWCSVGEAKQ